MEEGFTAEQLKYRKRAYKEKGTLNVRTKPNQKTNGFMPYKRREHKGLNPYAYKISDHNFGELYVLKATHGWWKDPYKVKELILAFKMGCTDEEACVFAGISRQGFRDFQEYHPEFWEIKEQCKKLMHVQARKNIRSMLQNGDKDVTKWYAERQMEDYEPKSTTKKKEYNMSELLQTLKDNSQVVDYNDKKEE